VGRLRVGADLSAIRAARSIELFNDMNFKPGVEFTRRPQHGYSTPADAGMRCFPDLGGACTQPASEMVDVTKWEFCWDRRAGVLLRAGRRGPFARGRRDTDRAALRRVLIGRDQLRQVFNHTDAEVLRLIIDAPEELEFLQGSKPKMTSRSPIRPNPRSRQESRRRVVAVEEIAPADD
jgi:hypothetical protein